VAVAPVAGHQQGTENGRLVNIRHCISRGASKFQIQKFFFI